ncbi:MAG: hypothetical protein FVQ80_08450 [Planctomycetes bacterium]|nr:hypothetical protein [Planctomycetota bacterium]
MAGDEGVMDDGFAENRLKNIVNLEVDMGNLFSQKLSSYLKTTALITILTVFTPMLTMAKIQAEDDFGRKLDRQTTSRKVAQEWLMVGKTQYKKGFYSDAERSLLVAKQYQKYLDENEAQILDQMLEQTHAIVMDQKRIPQDIQAVRVMIEEKKLYDAKIKLQRISTEENITKKQMKVVERLFEEVDQGFQPVEAQRVLRNIQKADELIRQRKFEDARILLEQTLHSEYLDGKTSTNIIRKLAFVNNEIEAKKQDNEIKVTLDKPQKTDESIDKGLFAQPKPYLETTKAPEIMTEKPLLEIEKRQRKIDAQLDLEQRQIAELYAKSMEYYRNNQQEKARQGFNRIDRILANRKRLSEQADRQDAIPLYQPKKDIDKKDTSTQYAEQPKQGQVVLQEQAEEQPKQGQVVLQEQAEEQPKQDQVEQEKQPQYQPEDDIDMVTRKTKILRSYIKAVVTDAITKSQKYTDDGQFKKAKKIIALTEKVVQEHRQHLGNEVVSYINSLLRRQTEWVNQQEKEAAWQ